MENISLACHKNRQKRPLHSVTVTIQFILILYSVTNCTFYGNHFITVFTKTDKKTYFESAVFSLHSYRLYLY
jgi:hypothetical protein